MESEAHPGHGDAVLPGEAEEAVRGFSDPADPNRAIGDPAGDRRGDGVPRMYPVQRSGRCLGLRKLTADDVDTVLAVYL